MPSVGKLILSFYLFLHRNFSFLSMKSHIWFVHELITDYSTSVKAPHINQASFTSIKALDLSCQITAAETVHTVTQHKEACLIICFMKLSRNLGTVNYQAISNIHQCTMKQPKIKGKFHGTHLINHGWPWYIQINHGQWCVMKFVYIGTQAAFGIYYGFILHPSAFKRHSCYNTSQEKEEIASQIRHSVSRFYKCLKAAP